MPLLHRTRLLLVCAMALAGCVKPSDPDEVARRFFHQLAAGQTQAAYISAAFAFQARQSARVFAATVEEMGLDEMVGEEWQPAEVAGQDAKVAVTITTRHDGKLPFIVRLHQESGTWRIFSIKSPPSPETGISENRFSLVGKTTAFADALSQSVPDEAEVRRLIKATLLLFDDAIAEKSPANFITHLSDAWQRQLTPTQLERAFRPFIAKKVRITQIGDLEAELDAPARINTEGLLVVTGRYPTQPYRIVFELKYTYELPNWKPYGVEVALLK